MKSHRDQKIKYKGNTVQSAIDEANEWLEMETDVRLDLCQFKYDPQAFQNSDLTIGESGLWAF